MERLLDFPAQLAISGLGLLEGDEQRASLARAAGVAVGERQVQCYFSQFGRRRSRLL
jgi:hypothetical protein